MRLSIALMLSAALLVLAGCAAMPTPPSTGAAVPGFWMGLWHGLIFPIAFVVSLFRSDVGIYSSINNGVWYNFGFFLGVGGLASGIWNSRR